MTTTNKLMIALALVILVGLSIGIATTATKKAKSDKRTLDIAAGLGSDGQGGFNPTPYTDSIFADLYVSYFADDDLYQNLIKMTDAEIRAIFLDWDKRYKSKKENGGKPLATAIYSGSYNALSWYRFVGPFHAKLVALGLE